MSHCGNEDHVKQVSIYSEDLMQMCVKAGDDCFPKVRKKESQIPYWNTIMQPQKESALFWNGIWAQCGKPRHGAVLR